MNWIPRWSHYITRKPKALCRNHPRLLPEPCPSHGMPCQTVSCMRDTVRHGATRCSRHRARNGQESGTGRAPARIGYHNIIPHTGSTFRKDRDPACQKPDDHNFSCKNEQLSILLTRSTRGMFVLRFCMHVVRQSFLDTTTARDGGMTASQNHTTSAGFIDEYGVCVCVNSLNIKRDNTTSMRDNARIADTSTSASSNAPMLPRRPSVRIRKSSLQRPCAKHIYN